MDISKGLKSRILMVNKYLNLLLQDKHHVELNDILTVVSPEMRAEVDIINDDVVWNIDMPEVEFVRARNVA